MKKIIAKQVSPENMETSFYFDGDVFNESSGDIKYAIYINEQRNCYGFNMDEYKNKVNQAQDVWNGLDDVLEKYGMYKNYKEVMEKNNISYNSKKCNDLKSWGHNNDPLSFESMAEYLTITTGLNWEVKEFHGYCQGDYCDILYCTDIYDNESIKEIASVWLGTCAEFIIDDCGGYFVTDDILWTGGDTLRNKLAEISGEKPEELEIYLYKDTTTTRTDNFEVMEG